MPIETTPRQHDQPTPHGKPSLGAEPSFADLGVQQTFVSALARARITVPTPIQIRAIPPLLQGRDVMGQARTGSGKTLAFALPIVDRCDSRIRGVQALVLVPTRELAIQVGGVIAPLGALKGLRSTLLYGGRSLLPEKQALLGRVHIVVGTPGRTLDHLRQGNLSLGQLRVFVLDEGDEMLDQGFAPDVERILGFAPQKRQTALFSATLPDWVLTVAARHLQDPVQVHVDAEFAGPPEIEHVVYEMDVSAKLNVLGRLLDQRAGGQILVFGRTKHGVKKLARQLEQMGYPVGSLQGNLSQNARERALAAFRSGDLPILCATNVAARGLDIEGIGQVINFDLPESAELFTHRAGRTGRMGRQGEAITFVTPEEAPKLRQIERLLGRRLRSEVAPGEARPAAASPVRTPAAASRAAGSGQTGPRRVATDAGAGGRAGSRPAPRNGRPSDGPDSGPRHGGPPWHRGLPFRRGIAGPPRAAEPAGLTAGRTHE